MRLALFDLDHTLIPFDSGGAWTRFLVNEGVLGAEAEAVYLDFCHQYVAGTLDIHAMHRQTMTPLAALPADTLAALQAAFGRSQQTRLPPDMRALVDRHRDAGDLCAIATATTRLVAEPFARAFGVDELVCTEAVPGSGEIHGLPCFREHKVTRVQQWLAARAQPPRDLGAFEASWFYSDSISDLPLLDAVTHPVAVRPDKRLHALAASRGWPVIDAACDWSGGG